MDRLIIPQQIFEEMLSHCRACYPNEACGILAGREKEVSDIYAMENIEKSPVSYTMDSREQFEVMKDMRNKGLSMVAIYHSHPSSPAYPSHTDVGLAFYEECVYIIVSLMEEKPGVRGFTIREGKIEAIEIEVR